MAGLGSARLTITPRSSTHTATCTVACKVYFTAYEMAQMKEGLSFRLDCELWEDDTITPDDFLYRYGSRFFPDTTPASPESVSFSVVLGTSLLDQEWGRDEIYALLKLKNLYTGRTVTIRTNTITRSFIG